MKRRREVRMSFELLLLVAAAAAITCFLKGRPGKGLVVLVVLIGGTAAALAFSSAATDLILMPLVAGIALFLAWPPAQPASYWDRHGAVDSYGSRLIDAEPESRRWARAVAGAVIGLLPGVLFTAGVAVVDAVVGLTGDQAQIGFLGIPVAFFGMIGGALIGRHWVPRRAYEDDERHHHLTPA
jgi:hypothetical protein